MKMVVSVLLLFLSAGELVIPVNGIVNGAIALKRDWFVLLTREQGSKALECERVQCGGALVAQDMVLTAAHCFDNLIKPDGLPSRSPDTAWVGRQAMCDTDGDIGKGFDIGTVYISNLYDPNDDTNKHDVALIKLVEFGPGICGRGNLADNIFFATYGETNMTQDQPALQMFGFGRSTGLDSQTSTVLETAFTEYNAPPAEDCLFTQIDTTYQLCAGTTVSCYGDSGGPLVTLADQIGSVDVVGIASWMDVIFSDPTVDGYCNTDLRFADVYTKVEYYKDLLFANVCAHSASPPLSCQTAATTTTIRSYNNHTMIARDLPIPTTLQRLSWMALKTATRVAERSFFWGDWFN